MVEERSISVRCGGDGDAVEIVVMAVVDVSVCLLLRGMRVVVDDDGAAVEVGGDMRMVPLEVCAADVAEDGADAVEDDSVEEVAEAVPAVPGRFLRLIVSVCSPYGDGAINSIGCDCFCPAFPFCRLAPAVDCPAEAEAEVAELG